MHFVMFCRTREKINRPQTRRRRDNSEELLDKMRLLKDNLAAARSIMDEVVRRERRKRDLAVRHDAGKRQTLVTMTVTD
jgi:hypothetical protein